MIYLEMSRDEAHGGGGWAFPNCVWSPAKKANGSAWPYWHKILNIEAGDLVIHLRGVMPNARFVGYSRATGNGVETSQRPPIAQDWDFAKSFFRADLGEYVQFHRAISLEELFFNRREQLEKYFDINKARVKSEKLNLFYVRQSGRLQCQNGAYLSDVDSELLEALFGIEVIPNSAAESTQLISVETGSQLAVVKTRLGQAIFAKAIKNAYGNSCCFPSCTVSDPRFLVASHIARWSDNETLRGHLGNGLCLCLIHDKAFELGLFTLDEEFQVFVDLGVDAGATSIEQELRSSHGKQIKLSNVLPLEDALLEHWVRVDLSP